jgi:hypothetical protein
MYVLGVPRTFILLFYSRYNNLSMGMKREGMKRRKRREGLEIN